MKRRKVMKVLNFLIFTLAINLSVQGNINSKSDIKEHKSVMIRDTEIVEDNEYIRYHFNMGKLLGDIALRELKGSGGSRSSTIYQGFCSGNIGDDDCPSGYTVGYYVQRIFNMANEEQADFIATGNTLNGVTRTKVSTNAGLFDSGRRMNDIFKNWHKLNWNSSAAVGQRLTVTSNTIAQTNSGHSGDEIEKARNYLKKKNSSAWMASSRFKLLAIANRLDLADNYDARITGTASIHPSYYGEVHLIFGIQDDTMEASGNAFPMTFSMSFRNPLISNNDFNISGTNEANYNLTLSNPSDKNQPSDANWKTYIKRWSKKWSKLSDYNITSNNYQNRLIAILNTIVKPENFIGLRSNTQISSNEYEIREWYIFRSAIVRNNNNSLNRGQLIPRKPKNQPYECLNKSNALTNLVLDNWDSTNGDLKVKHILGQGMTYNVNRDPYYEETRAGYAVLREKDDRPFFLKASSAHDWDYDTNFVSYNSTGEVSSSEATNYWKFASGVSGSCGDTYETMPFYMLTGEGRNDGPWDRSTGSYSTDPLTTTHGYATKKTRAAKNQLMMLAPFGRVRKINSKWGYVWQKRSAWSEGQRHAFAIRTCTGCHSQEGAADQAFHVKPRVDGSASKLSPFLEGGSGSSFSRNSATYNYDVLQWRVDFLWDTHPNKPSVNPVRYDNLRRPEL